MLALVPTARSAEQEAPAADPCAAGKALYDSGRYAAAEQTYSKALGDPKLNPCGEAGLAKLDAVGLCASANSLQNAGRDAEALAAFEAVLKARPWSACAMRGIESLDPGFFDDPGASAQTVLAWLGLGALLVGGVAVAAAFLLWLMTWTPFLREVPPASRIRALRVGIEPFEDTAAATKLGPATASLVRAKIESFGGESSRLEMIDSQAAIEETVWTKFGAINDQAKAASAVLATLGALYPRRQFQVTGSLQAEGALGPGLTISLRQGRKLLAATTLWAQRFELTAVAEEDGAGKVERMQRLAVPAAAWISHSATTAAGKTPGGSGDPLSWALFKTGIEWEGDGETAKAMGLYRDAILIDRKNWGALYNLGGIEDELGDYKAAIDHLTQALEILEA